MHCSQRSRARLSRTTLCLLTAVAGLSQVAQALPPWWNATTQKGFQPNVPDYFQHQKWGTAGPGDPGAEATWEFLGGSAGGWCYMTAITNGLFKFKRDGYDVMPNGYDGASWLPHANARIRTLATEMINNGKTVDDLLPNSLRFKAVWVNGLGRVVYRSWVGERAYPAGTNLLDVASRDFKEDDVVLLRFDSDPPNTAPTWWNFHMVTLTGMELGANPFVYFADPDVNGGNTDNLAVFDLGTRPIAGVTAQRFAANAALPLLAPGAAGVAPAGWQTRYNRGAYAAGKIGGNGAGNTRYTDMPLTGLRVIEPQVLLLDPPVPAPGLPGRSIQRAVCSAGRYGSSDDFFIFPNAAVQAGSVTLDGPQFSSGNWLALAYPAANGPFIDPWGNAWHYGAIRVMRRSGSPIVGASPLNGVSFTVLGTVTAFDVHYKSADASDSGTWRVQSFGANFSEDWVQRPGPVAGLCPADFNQDGGVDGADVNAFFDAWEAGLNSADTNQDGGVDGSDVTAFFDAWEAGGC